MSIPMFLLGWIVMIVTVTASPVIYQDGKMFDVVADSKTTDAQLVYSFTSQLAVGYRYLKSMDEAAPIHLIQGNGLVHRWNSSDSQANIYAMAGVCVQNQTLGSYLGAEVDWESRRYYIAAATEQFWVGQASNKSVFRVGFAPYEAEYDDLNTWFIVQATQLTGTEKSQWILPIIRLFKDNVLVELGSNGSTHYGTFRMHF